MPSTADFTLTVRPFRPGEVDALHALWNRSAPLDRVPPAVFREKLETDADELALVADVDGVRVGLGVGVLWPVADEMRGSVRLLAVDPNVRRRGVGSALLDALEAEFRERGVRTVRIGEATPNYLTPGVDMWNEGGLAFAEARGYREIGEAVNLGVDLRSDNWDTEADEARLAAHAIGVRQATKADRPALGHLLNAHWPAWQTEADRALTHDPPTLHLALRDRTVLGFAAYDANNVGTGWFGPMGTAPEVRGLGVGAVLLRRCLRDLRRQGLDRATIAWATALPFYERACGATVERRFRRVEKRL